MQNVILTTTHAGTSTTVTIYATEVKEKIGKKLAVIPKPTSSRGTTTATTLIVDLNRIQTDFTVTGHFEDEQRTQLNGSLTSSATTITVDSTTGFAESGLVKVGLELCSYTGITGTAFTGVTRGVEGTTAIAHPDNDHVFIPAAQFRDQLFTILDYGGCFRMAYRRKNWSVACAGFDVTGRATDDESPRVFDVSLNLVVGQDLIMKAQTPSGYVTGRDI